MNCWLLYFVTVDLFRIEHFSEMECSTVNRCSRLSFLSSLLSLTL